MRHSEEVRERVTAQEMLAEAVQKLREANAQLSQQLRQREHAEAAKGALQEQSLAAQCKRLFELSAPLIPLLNGILVMPLSGTVDVERARQAVEAALCGAAERGADHLIIDITGITAVDETVASMLVQAARGLSLLGTRAVITGIRAEVAQTLMRLDLRLDDLVTKATRQSGLAHALTARGWPPRLDPCERRSSSAKSGAMAPNPAGTTSLRSKSDKRVEMTRKSENSTQGRKDAEPQKGSDFFAA